MASSPGQHCTSKMKSAPPFTGRCACNHVQYQLNAAPMFVHCCHCTWCQRESGSAFALNALIETTQLQQLSDETITHHLPSESGKGQSIDHCPKCATALWGHYAGMGESVVFIRAGSLDAASEVEPDIHIFTESKLPWVVIPEHALAVPQYYRASEVWPEESLARFRKARATT